MAIRKSFTQNQRVIAVRLFLTSSMSRDDVAARYGVQPETISRWVTRYRHRVEEEEGHLVGDKN